MSNRLAVRAEAPCTLDSIDVWKTAAEWAALGLPNVPTTERAIRYMAARQGWACRKREGRGGGMEYPLSALPSAALAAYRLRHEQPAVPALPVAPSSAPATVAAWQIACRDARLVLLGEVDTIQVRADLSARQAILALVDLAQKGQLRPDLQAIIPTANAKSGGKAGGRTLSRASLYDWRKAREEGGVAALLPKAPPKAGAQAWHPYFLRAWRQFQNPELSEVLRTHLPPLLPEGMEVPSYDQARRFLRSLSPQERERGRKGPRAMFALKAYKKRDTSDLEPTSIYTADGKLFPAEVMNPLSGLPFKPEVTTVLDVATKRAVGWSAALSENASGVTDALRNATMTGGIGAILYTDNGPGFDNIRLDAPLTGILARLGTVNYDSLPDRSHSRGLIEGWMKWWNKAAKRLPTYSGKDVDKEYAQAVHKITRKEIKEFGQSRLVMPWAEFLKLCQETIDTYNARPHSALPKITDPVTGKRRPMSPNECWADWEARGWKAVTVAPDEADDLFRSYEERMVNRCVVQIGGNEYHHTALDPYHGQKVAVGYDLHDANHVWVREVERTAEVHRLGRLICVADWDGHKTRYVPVSMEEQGKVARVEAAVRRLDDKKGRKLAELKGSQLLDHQPVAAPVEITTDEQDRADAMIARLEPVAEPVQRMAGGRPVFGSDLEWARWVLEHPTAATPQDFGGLREKLRRRTFRDLLEMEGVDTAALQGLTEQARGALCA